MYIIKRHDGTYIQQFKYVEEGGGVAFYTTPRIEYALGVGRHIDALNMLRMFGKYSSEFLIHTTKCNELHSPGYVIYDKDDKTMLSVPPGSNELQWQGDTHKAIQFARCEDALQVYSHYSHIPGVVVMAVSEIDTIR